MASKKKTQPKRKVISAPKTPKVKMLDFTKDRTTPVAKNYEKGISKLLINYLKNSNIPVLVELSKDQEILPHYFLDQTFYARMLGDNIYAQQEGRLSRHLAQRRHLCDRCHTGQHSPPQRQSEGWLVSHRAAVCWK